MIENDDTPPEKRKPGGQPGNCNARVHGFYSRALTPAQQEQLEAAGEVRGVDAEIAMLRVKILSILDNDPENAAVLLRAITALTRLVKVKAQYPEKDTAALKDAILNIFGSPGIPPGFGQGAMFEKAERDFPGR